MKRSAKTIVLAALSACLFTAAGCNSNAASGDSAASQSSSGSSTNLDALSKRVNGYVTAPTGIGITSPLSRKPDADKFIVGILTPLAVAKTESAAQAAAAKLLGWRYREIQQGTGPQDAPKALDAAVALKPDGIIYYGTPRQPMAAGLDKAQAAGIPVVATAQVDPLAPPIIANNSNSGDQLKAVGAGLADWVALDSKLGAKVALVTLPAYPVLAAFGNGFKDQLKSDCPGCAVTELPQQLTDIGTVTPTSVVNALRRDPSIKYVVFDNGSTPTGVPAAITAAGITGVVLGGEAPGATTVAEMKQGADEAWAALSIPILGFSLIDVLARHFNGDPLTPNVSADAPFQILTKDNIGSAALDSQQNYVGYPDYADAYAKLWHVG
jgi:ribose transport system substrate-binding protein